ncbi:MAG: hypothetical protein IKO97_10465, partial [Erysipelotrichaceae bacterium]|nr:hypothetical protein [Erysipelotrichaceae bacterium]
SSLSREDAFRFLLSAALGLDPSVNERDRRIEDEYLKRSVRLLNKRTFADDPYYSLIKFPEVSEGRWSFARQSYAPYELIPYDDIEVLDDFTEIPMVGFFDEEFVYPAVLENGNEWMMVTPEETGTIRAAIDAASGDVITFGLGLGYYPFMVSRKQNVRSVTVIETDGTVIDLFERYLLPQFPNREKIKVLNADGFAYARDIMPKEHFDHAFVDMWHDASDGLPMYIKMKRLESLNSDTSFLYWIERSILSRLRWFVFDSLTDGSDEDAKLLKDIHMMSQEKIEYCLQDAFLRDLASVVTFKDNLI